jgi:hypothetical protein
MAIKGGYFQWPLLVGALLAVAAVYAALPTSNSGPKSVTVVGITAPRPAFRSYPGLRVPVTRQPQAAPHYPT